MKAAKLDELADALRNPNLTTKLLTFQELARRMKADAKFAEDAHRKLVLTVVWADSVRPGPEATDFLGWVSHLLPTPVEQPPKLDRKKWVREQKALPGEPYLRDNGLSMRAGAAQETWDEAMRDLVIAVLEEIPCSGHYYRALIDGIVLHPHADFVPPC